MKMLPELSLRIPDLNEPVQQLLQSFMRCVAFELLGERRLEFVVLLRDILNNDPANTDWTYVLTDGNLESCPLTPADE